MNFQTLGQHADPKNKGGSGKTLDAPDEVTKFDKPAIFNVIKLSPFNLIRGEAIVGYERRVTDKLSLDFTGGITFYNTIGFLWDLVYGNGNSKSNSTYLIGPAAQVSLKYFFGENSMRGWYMGGNYRYSRFRFKFTPLDSFFPEYLKTTYNEGIVQLGYQNMNTSEKLFHEWYFGFGLRVRKDTDLDSGNGLNNELRLVELSPRTIPTFKLGLKLGFQLK